MFDYLFFDLDGTLTDPALGITNSFKHVLKYFGIEIPSYEKLCSFIGPPLVDTFKTQFGFASFRKLPSCPRMVWAHNPSIYLKGSQPCLSVQMEIF